MSVFSFESSQGNPITKKDVISIGREFGVHEKDEKSLDDYKTMLAVFHDSCEEIMGMEDYIPKTDLQRFPRENIHYPERSDDPLNAWGHKVTIKEKTCLKKDYLLKNMTVAVKDCICVAGVPMLLGTEFVTGYTPDQDATLVTRLLECGATIVGKAVCENLCHSCTSHSAGTGLVQNPLAPGYSSGGSSSGSAALTAAGDVDIAIGADQGGSVRIPAAWCGTVGMKPTFGLVPFTGCASNESTNDHIGIITKDILKNAKALQSIAGSDNIDDRGFNSITEKYFDELISLADPTDLKGFKIAVLKEGFENPAMEPRVRENCMKAVEKFKELGATVVEVSIPLHHKGPLIWTGISKVGGYLTKIGCAIGRRGHSLNSLNEKFLQAYHDQQHWDRAYPSSKNIYYNGAYALKHYPSLYGKCMNLSRKLKDDYNKVLDNYDVIVLPTVPSVARSHPDVEKELSPLELLDKQRGVSSNTAGFDQSGHPALALPCGMLPITEGPLANSDVMLPNSLQIVGKWYDEKTVYRVAYAWERAFDYKKL